MNKNANGKVLGTHYSIQGQLGKKPGRYTYLALDNQTQDLVVVKLLKLDSDFEWDSLKLFEREAQILKNISHGAIPQYLDYFEVDSPETKGFALVQSYIDAKSLEEQVKTGRTFNEAELKEIAKQILNILIYLHQRKPAIIHRDIKPSNILLTNRSGNSVGEVYLVDFGSVQNINTVENGTLTVVGTYGYMSPEHFGGRAVPTSDLYSLGATLVNLATGIHPADFPQKDLQIQFEGEINLSKHFTTWLKKVLEPRQEKRFDSAEVALEALQKPEQIKSSFSQNMKIKPANTKVIVNQNADQIEIMQPGTEIIGKYVKFIIQLFVFLFFITAFNYTIFKLGMIIAFFGLLLCFFDYIYGKNRLIINRNIIYFGYKIFGLKFKTSPTSLRKDIIKLEYTTPYIAEVRDNEGNISHHKISSSIIIWAGTKQYKLTRMTQTEFDWLTQELSTWLELPVQHQMIPVVKSK